MKKHIIFTLLIMNFLFANAQDIQSGIYEIDAEIDSLFIKTNSGNIRTITAQYCKNKSIKYDLSPLISKRFRAKYAVLVSAKDASQILTVKMIVLNENTPETNISYSDTNKRKFYDLSFSVSAKNKQSWYFTGNNDFFKYSSVLDDFASDYDLQEDWKKKKNVDRDHDNTTFLQQDNIFYLKSPAVKVSVDSIISAKTEPTLGTESYDSKTTCYFTIQQLVSSFKLKKAKNYISIVPLQKEVVFSSEKGPLQLNAGDFLAVTNEDEEWYFGDYVQPDGEIISGKIFKVHLVSNLKVKILTMNQLQVAIYYSHFGNSYRTEQGDIAAIKIYDKQKILLQVLQYPGLIDNTENIVTFDDVNFDGHKDIVVYSHDGGAGPNFGNNYYIYHPKIQQFVFNEFMSNLSQPEIDPKNKIVYAAWRDGAANHGFEQYKWIKGQLTQVEYYETRYVGDDEVEVTHLILKNGKMQGKTKVVKEGDLKKF